MYLVELLAGSDVDSRCGRERVLLDCSNPDFFRQCALSSNQILNEHAARRDDIGNAALLSDPGGGPRRPEKNRMQMNQVEAGDLSRKRLFHARRPVEPAQKPTWKVTDCHPIDAYRFAEGHIAVTGPIDIGGKDVHIVTQECQRRAQTVNGSDRTAVAHGREVGGHDVEYSHVSTAMMLNEARLRPPASSPKPHFPRCSYARRALSLVLPWPADARDLSPSTVGRVKDRRPHRIRTSLRSRRV